MLLLAERTTFCEPGPASGGLAENGGASNAKDNRLCVAEDGGDLVAAGTLNVHEEGVRVLHQTLQLVLALLILRARVKEILGEGHVGNLNCTGQEQPNPSSSFSASLLFNFRGLL